MTADTVGGVWTYCLELCRSLSHEVHFHLVTSGALLQTSQRWEIEALANVTLYETNWKLEWMSEPWDDIDASGIWLLQLEAKVKPDLVHLNSYSYAALPFRAPKIVVAHSDVFSWFEAVKGEKPGPEWNVYYERVHKGLQSAQAVIAPSAAVMEQVKRIYEVENECRVIYNGRNEELFRAGEKQPCIMTLGRIWDEAKNAALLVKASHQIPYPIRIAGDNSFEPGQDISGGDNVTYLGKLPPQRVAEELSNVYVYALPARYEPFGLSALEAALSGCALVLGDIASLREIWQDAAVYVDPEDEKQLASAINQLMQDKTLLEEYARRAKERAHEFTARSSAQQYLELYHQLAGEKELITQETI
jgi:glycogen(starch) synthase